MSKISVKSGMKRFIAGVSAVLVIGGSSTFAYKKITDTTPQDSTRNTIGYSDVNPYFNTDVKENEFVILNVGNHSSIKDIITLQSDKFKFCNEKNISLGIIIESNATKQLDIYNDVEYAKEIVSKYKIDFPVYLDIDKIMTNNDLNSTVKTELIQDFAKKATSNGMYFGICGKDTNLYNLNKYCFDISKYDVYLKEDSNERKYQGTCNIVEDLNGNITSKYDLSSIIEDKKLNKENNFVEDAYYIVDNDDTIDEIALSFGLSVNDLLNFNDKEIEDIKEGLVLRIPNNIQLGNKIIDKKINDKAIKKGVDLSYCQTSVDFEKLSSNVDYAILKLSEGTTKDNLFESHITNCLNNGIPVGIYSITHATTVDDIKKEAKNVVELLKNRKITYPVYLDFEADPSKTGEWSRWTAIKESGIMKEFLNAWNDIIREAGYIPGIYCNQSIYLDIYEQTNSKENNFLNKFETWIAGSNTYSNACDYKNIVDPGCTFEYQGLKVNCNMRQVSEACTGIGAGTESGYVDFNYCYTDYENSELEYEYEFDIKETNKEQKEKILKIMYASFSGCLIMFIGSKIIIYKVKKKKRKKENNRRQRI